MNIRLLSVPAAIVLVLVSSCGSGTFNPENYNDSEYTYTVPIKPSGCPETDIRNQVQAYYSYWADKYLKQADTNGKWYYVSGDSTGETPESWGDTAAKATSEGHGYGMIITALMGRHTEFDGLYNMFRAFPSTENGNLMSWIIPADEDTSLRSDSAADGDMDIAYALLLADRRWGSGNGINYKAEAVKIINAVMKSEISHKTWRPLLGDWDEDEYSTRPSDWMPDHFRAFRDASGDNRWNNVIAAVYGMRLDIVNRFSHETGLLPDFVIGRNPEPAPPDYLESRHDGDYYYNACRVPLRIACDYVLYGAHNGREAKLTLKTMEDWIIKTSSGDPGNIKAGYTLKGKPLVKYSDGCFTAPFIAAAVSDPKYGDFLDRGWKIIRDSRSSYFNDTITMLTMLLVSGIWQAP